MSATILDLLANPPALNVPREHAAVQNIQATTAATQAQAERERALTEQTQAVTAEQQTKNRILQQQLRDAEIQRSIFADAGRAAAAPPAPEAGFANPVTGEMVQNPAAAGVPTRPPAPNYWDNPQAFASEMSRRGASAQGTIGAMRGLVELKQNLLKLTPDQVAAENALHGQVAASLQGYLERPTDQAYAQFYQDAVSKEPELQRELPQPGQGIAPDQNALAHVIGKVHLLGTLLANAKTKQETATSAATAANAAATKAKTEAEIPGINAETKLKELRAENGIVGTDKFETIFLPAYAANLGKKVKDLTPQEKMASFTAFKQYDTNPEAMASLLASRNATMAMHQQTLQNAQFQRGQQSYQFSSNALDKIAKPVTDLVGRLGRLEDTLAQGSPQADALVAPELLSVMAGGQGSGLRMNEAEIARIVGGRSKWETLKAKINQWSLDPSKANSITPEQRKQIHDLVADVGAKIRAKQAIVDDARSGLSTSNNPMEHRQILTKATKDITSVDAGAAAKAGVLPAGVKALLDTVGPGIHTLSDGTKWMKAQDGTITKQ